MTMTNDTGGNPRPGSDSSWRKAFRWLAAGILLSPGLVATGQTAASGNAAAAPEKTELDRLLDAKDEGTQRDTGGTKHQLGASVDYFFGIGEMLFPNTFALSEHPDFRALKPNVQIGERESDYLGATVTYSYGQAWYLDFSYSKGTSSGGVDQIFDYQTDAGRQSTLPTRFDMDDDWYQLYVRYVFPKYSGSTKYSLYLRGGVSLVDARLNAISDPTVTEIRFVQETEYQDLLFNLGFGLTRQLYARGPFKFGVQLEGEGAVGSRTTKTSEVLTTYDPLTGENGSPQGGSHKMEGTLFALTGRGTAHAEYALGRKRLSSLFLEGGMQTKYLIVAYPSLDRGPGNPGFVGDRFAELLWGPYVKFGFQYSF